MKRLLIGVLVGSLVSVSGVTAQTDMPPKQPPAGHAAARLVVKPGETVRWRSPHIGRVRTLGLVVAGREAFYAPEARTRNCVAYGYEAGVAVRLTDCVQGRRVPYVRLRAVSAALKPVTVVLRLNGG